jgi:putative transcriptional regulator
MQLMTQKQLRENRIIRSAEIIRETGLTRPTVQTWIKGELHRFDEDAIIAFCKYFECGIGDLLEIVDDE